MGCRPSCRCACLTPTAASIFSSRTSLPLFALDLRGGSQDLCAALAGGLLDAKWHEGGGACCAMVVQVKEEGGGVGAGALATARSKHRHLVPSAPCNN